MTRPRRTAESAPPARRRRAPVLTAFAVWLGAIVMAGAAQAGWPTNTGGHGWRVEPTPNPAGAGISVLSSVSCPSPRACTAVGSSARTLSSPTRTLAERWSGGRWRIQAIPTPKRTSDSLYGVSCPSARVCIAVGSAFDLGTRRQTILSEAWNGRRWRVLPTPPNEGRDSALQGVSCVSASACLAVGSWQNAAGSVAVVEHWNGRAWSIQATPPDRTTLLGVSCASARACTAVGYQKGASGNGRPFAESWNGSALQPQAVPLPHGASGGIFDAVSCTSVKACTATGTDFTHPNGPTLAERWNGRVWRVEPTPNPANFSVSVSEVELRAVSCTSARACTAVGAYSPGHAAAYFVESWNGRRWRLARAPHPAGFFSGSLLGLACASARCTAVGAYSGGPQIQVTLALGA